MSQFRLSWVRAREDWGFLKGSRPSRELQRLCGTYTEVAFDPREYMNVENQGQQGSCAGHSISSCMEYCYVIATGGEKIQLSRAMGYYETQRLDGINGDRGSTISGGIKLAMSVGICEEEMWKYPSRYDNRRPRNWEEVLENAAKYKIGSRYVIDSYEALRAFTGSGQGPVHAGITWNSSADRPVVESYSGNGGGGHAVGFYCPSERKDRRGDPYQWMMNSWGRNWGQGGWSEWSPTAIRQMLASSYTVAIGVSDMPEAKARPLGRGDFKKIIADEMWG